MKFNGHKNWHSGKPVTLLLSLLLIFGIVTSGTLAYLFVSSSLLSNSFRSVKVTSRIEETFDTTVKSSIKVKNTGDINAWIRVALVPTWENNSGNAVNQPVNEGDINVSINTVSWFKGTDGYYYCRDKIATDKSSPEMLSAAISVNPSSAGYIAGYHMNLQVLCEAIQSEPVTAVTSVWPVTVSGDKLS